MRPSVRRSQNKVYRRSDGAERLMAMTTSLQDQQYIAHVIYRTYVEQGECFRRWSRMTPSDFSFGATGSVTSATSMESTAAASRSWLAVPSTTTSDLSAFRRRSFERYQSRTAVEHARSMLRMLGIHTTWPTTPFGGFWGLRTYHRPTQQHHLGVPLFRKGVLLDDAVG